MTIISHVRSHVFHFLTVGLCGYELTGVYYASPSSGEAYRDRQLTTSFELKFFVCRHVSI